MSELHEKCSRGAHESAPTLGNPHQTDVSARAHPLCAPLCPLVVRSCFWSETADRRPSSSTLNQPENL